MRSFVPDYELQTPSDLGDALETLKRDPGVWRPFAGGTDLMVLFEAGKLPHKKFLNIRGLPELRGIEVTDTEVILRALTTYTEIQRHPLLRREFPMLVQSSAETGGVAIQNRGTLGGNIANASPAADSGPVLLAHDAELDLVSSKGSRRVPYSAFHTGYKKMDLRADELVRAIHLPRRPGWIDYFRKVGTRKAQAISKICYAQRTRVEDGKIVDVRIALGSVAPIVIRCPKAEASIIANGRARLADEITPIDDIRSTAAYRLRVAQNLLDDALRSIKLT